MPTTSHDGAQGPPARQAGPVNSLSSHPFNNLPADARGFQAEPWLGMAQAGMLPQSPSTSALTSVEGLTPPAPPPPPPDEAPVSAGATEGRFYKYSQSSGAPVLLANLGRCACSVHETTKIAPTSYRGEAHGAVSLRDLHIKLGKAVSLPGERKPGNTLAGLHNMPGRTALWAGTSGWGCALGAPAAPGKHPCGGCNSQPRPGAAGTSRPQMTLGSRTVRISRGTPVPAASPALHLRDFGLGRRLPPSDRYLADVAHRAIPGDP
jgi:hypothetical protein